MKKFSSFLREMRDSAWITQDQLAKNLGVSKILITSLETESREPSKQFIDILAKKLWVKSASILPFISDESIHSIHLNGIEKKIIILIEDLQIMLIKKKSYKLLENA